MATPVTETVTGAPPEWVTVRSQDMDPSVPGEKVTETSFDPPGDNENVEELTE